MVSELLFGKCRLVLFGRRRGNSIMKSILSAALVFAILGTPAIFAAENRLVVHEWGTFTSLQDEQGKRSRGSIPMTNRFHTLSTALPTIYSSSLNRFGRRASTKARRNVIRMSRCDSRRRSCTSTVPMTRRRPRRSALMSPFEAVGLRSITPGR